MLFDLTAFLVFVVDLTLASLTVFGLLVRTAVLLLVDFAFVENSDFVLDRDPLDGASSPPSLLPVFWDFDFALRVGSELSFVSFFFTRLFASPAFDLTVFLEADARVWVVLKRVRMCAIGNRSVCLKWQSWQIDRPAAVYPVRRKDLFIEGSKPP